MQLEEAIAYVKGELDTHGNAFVLDKAKLETASGVGLNITDADIHGWVNG